MDDLINLSGHPRKIGTTMAEVLRRNNDKVRKFLELLTSENDAIKKLPSYDANALDTLWKIIVHRSPDISAWIDGLGKGLNIPTKELLLFHVGSYFRDLDTKGEPFPKPFNEECSTFAVSHSKEGPILAKNRDCAAIYGTFQALIRVRPLSGLGYIAMTTYGIAGVHSSGMNEQGLAVADTHVVSSDIGYGIPRFALMHKLLNECTTVNDALGTIVNERVMGRGNLIMADASGTLGVAELGHNVCMVRRANSGVMVNTNHFTDVYLKKAFIDTNTTLLKGTSYARFAYLQDQLANGCHDLESAKLLMSHHGNALDSLCRHEDLDPPYRTISTVFYLPQKKKIVFADDYPCVAQYKELVWR